MPAPRARNRSARLPRGGQLRLAGEVLAGGLLVVAQVGRAAAAHRSPHGCRRHGRKALRVHTRAYSRVGGVGAACHARPVDVTEADIARIPVGNLRVSRGEFAAVWAEAERRDAEHGGVGITDWYSAGVVVTCRWLARAVVPFNGRRMLARSPATGQRTSAYEELIEAEYLAAEELNLRQPDLLEFRPGWVEAIRATLRWAWRHEAPPPFAVPATLTAGRPLGCAAGHGAPVRSSAIGSRSSSAASAT